MKSTPFVFLGGVDVDAWTVSESGNAGGVESVLAALRHGPRQQPPLVFAVDGDGRARSVAWGREALGGDETFYVVLRGGSHDVAIDPFGGAMLRCADGGWQPLRVAAHFEYSVRQPELLVETLARERIRCPEEFENELARTVSECLMPFMDGESWQADTLPVSLELASGALLPQLESVMAPYGVALESFELFQADATGPLGVPSSNTRASNR